MKRYAGTERGNRLLGTAMSIIPKAGYSGFATTLPLAVSGVLVNAVITVDANIANCLPSNKTIESIVTERAVDSIILVRESIRKNKHMYLFADKGNKAGNSNLAKYVGWYDDNTKRV